MGPQCENSVLSALRSESYQLENHSKNSCLEEGEISWPLHLFSAWSLQKVFLMETKSFYH